MNDSAAAIQSVKSLVLMRKIEGRCFDAELGRTRESAEFCSTARNRIESGLRRSQSVQNLVLTREMEQNLGLLLGRMSVVMRKIEQVLDLPPDWAASTDGVQDLVLMRETEQVLGYL